MEQITHYSTFFKGILDTNPWIWHLLQVFFLFIFFTKTTKILGKIKNSKLVFFISKFQWYLSFFWVFVYSKMAVWGILIAILNHIYYDLLFGKINSVKKNIGIKYIIYLFLELLTIFSIFAISDFLDFKLKIGLMLVWLLHLQQIIMISINSFKYEKLFKIEPDNIGSNMMFFTPIWISLILVPNSWFLWIIIVFIIFEPRRSNYPSFFLSNDSILIDDWKKTVKIFPIILPCIIVFYLFGFSVYSYFFIGALFFFSNMTTILSNRSLFNSPIKFYDSQTIVTGNYNYLRLILLSNKFLLLVQRIAINIKEEFTYGLVLSPYENVIVEHNSIKNLNELIPLSHHLILVDGGEQSDKIIRIENDFISFSGRVDTVIDYYSIANQTIDKYSNPIENEHAACVRERIAIKQAIIDEKAFVLNDNPEEEAKTIDTFINSINTESVRINMLVREYFKENTIDYEQLQSELINNGPFEINTLLRQMREGGSIPSRFVDALSIAEVAARYLFSLTNEFNNYLDKNENSIQDRNKFYSKLSFGPCIGFLRDNIIKKSKKNEFEKTVKELLEIKYNDSDNFERLKKYLITDLHYDKEVNDKPNLNDLFNYMAYIRNKTRGHGTPSKVEFEFYITLDLISIFIVHCISKIEIETFSRQIINDKEWLLYYNAGGNVVLYPLDTNENLEYWKDSFDWKYLDKMEQAKNIIQETNQSVYLKIKYQEDIHWIKAETYFKCKEGIIYMYDGINKDEAEWISFTTGAVIRPYRIN
jgi:hypothetical protein